MDIEISDNKEEVEVKSNYLHVIPLGGLGEIGKNMMAIRYNNDIIVIDAGLAFPSTEHLGVDYIIPNSDYLIKNQNLIRGIFLTHGHEDHIGGVNDFLKRFTIQPPTIYGTRLTIGLVEDKLTYKKVFGEVTLETVKARDIIPLGEMEIEILSVCHSIADSIGLAIMTPLGTIIHTGDFKLDPTPIDGKLTDLYKFAEYGEKGVLLLMSDSTNVNRAGYTPSEKEVAKGLINAIGTATGRVIVTAFASNIHRVQQIIDISARFNRKIALVGRSMERVTRKAMDMGYVSRGQASFIKGTDIENYKDEELTIVTTGAQGEPMAVLSRIANDEFHIKVAKGDTIIISAIPIPGNEKMVFNTINKLFSKGAEVIYEAHNNLHVSGHASAEELKLMINITKPKYFLPVHGENRHLIHHAELARNLNVAPENAFVLNNGDVLEITETSAEVIGKVPANKILIDGNGLGHVEEDVLKERQVLSREGVIVVSVSINANYEVVSEPQVISKGFIIHDDNNDFYSNAGDYIKTGLERYFEKNKNEVEFEEIEAELAKITSDYAYSKTKRKSFVIATVNLV